MRSAISVVRPSETHADEAVYPEIWADEGESALTEYLLPHFQTLKAFFARSAEAKQQVLVFFN